MQASVNIKFVTITTYFNQKIFLKTVLSNDKYYVCRAKYELKGMIQDLINKYIALYNRARVRCIFFYLSGMYLHWKIQF